MTNEEKYVVNPLQEYFLDQQRSGASWKLLHRPSTGIAATGWDLQIGRHNQVLLIEAKYFTRSFIGSFAGLVTAPLTNRPEKTVQGMYRSWSSKICWAVGSGYKNRNIYQIFFDYLSREPSFWPCYVEALKIGDVYFVEKNKVARISFKELIKLADSYKKQVNVHEIKLEGKRRIANELMKNSLEFV